MPSDDLRRLSSQQAGEEAIRRSVDYYFVSFQSSTVQGVVRQEDSRRRRLRFCISLAQSERASMPSRNSTTTSNGPRSSQPPGAPFETTPREVFENF
jgi:hypothetical protein